MVLTRPSGVAFQGTGQYKLFATPFVRPVFISKVCTGFEVWSQSAATPKLGSREERSDSWDGVEFAFCGWFVSKSSVTF
jgi:hypothetical protein